MARRSSNKSTTEAPEATTEEAPVSTDTTTAPEAEASTEAPAPEATTEASEAAAVEVDLTDFNAAVQKALDEKDNETGDVPLVAFEAITAEYRKLDGPKPKNAAKRSINERMKSAMNDMNIADARAYLQISDKALSAGTSGGHGERKPTDPTEAFVQRIVTLRLASDLATDTVPEGVEDGWENKVSDQLEGLLTKAQEYRTWVDGDEDERGDEPDVTAVVKNAVKLAEGKTAKAGARIGGGAPFTGERRDIGKHILAAFEDVEEGKFLTVAEIVNHKSEEYGDSKPSAGAVSARLFPNNDPSKCTLIKDGVQPGQNEKGNKGATKVAVAA